jgi:hypothetical protein
MNGEQKSGQCDRTEEKQVKRYCLDSHTLSGLRGHEEGPLVFWSDYERLRETFLYPRLTPDAPAEQFTAILRDHDKGHPVNAQDLINALMWRVKNQRHEISKLHERLRRKASDEAPSFSPNFDERNGIR